MASFMEKTGFLFAGQGSQYVGMGKDLYDTFPESKAVFDQACESLGFDLKKYCFEGPAEELKPTNISQPAIVTVSIAALAAFKKKTGLIPVYCAGLSLGEYSSLICAGTFSFKDGISLISKRGQIMEEAARKNPGKMAAVLDLAIEKIQEICVQSGAEIANLNCPGQTVITGKAEAVLKASELCSQAGAKKVIMLEVSGGFHSSLMLDAAEKLETVLIQTQMKDALIPVISNYTAQPQDKVELIRGNLVKQIHSSVRWEESVRFMLAQGVTRFFEIGPGKVLKGLMRKIDPAAQVVNIDKAEEILKLA
jgi:[acyl-carrier-protein] S-malonyltransferase